MKNVLLLGATGTASSALTKKLLSETDCHLTLFARHTREMYTDTDRISVINGDAENIAELKAILPNQDVVYCAISGDALPKIAENIVSAMTESNVNRLIFMGAVGIYNEIDGEYNLDNEPALVKFAIKIILDDALYSRESVSITHDAAKVLS